jgi:signal peptidase II
MARRVAYPLLLLLSVLLVGCDHATKALAVHGLSGVRRLTLWPGVLDLSLTHNYDSAFSLWRRLGLEPSAGMLIAGTSAALVGLLALAWRNGRDGGSLERAGFAMAVAGAVGNLIDRVARGYVVDFVHLRYWPVFNVADVWISAGLGLVVLASVLERRAARLRR